MKKSLLSGFVMAALVVSSAAFAEGDAAPKKEKAATAEAKPKLTQFAGEITAMDATAGTLTVKGTKDEATKTFKCAADCKVSIADKKDATCADLKVGDKVNVGFAEENGVAIAKKIGPVKAPAPKKEKKDKPAAQ